MRTVVSHEPRFNIGPVSGIPLLHAVGSSFFGLSSTAPLEHGSKSEVVGRYFPLGSVVESGSVVGC